MKKLQKTINEIMGITTELTEMMNIEEIFIKLSDGNIIIIESEDSTVTIPIDQDENVLSNTDAKNVLLYCINYLYNNNIKQCKRYISTSKTIYKNKIGKLSKLMTANDGKIEADMFNKVFTEYTNLTADMVIRYNTNAGYEEMLCFCNSLVKLFFETLNVLYKDWKQEDIAEYVTKHGYKCQLNKNKTVLSISIKNDEEEMLDTLNVNVNNYSKKNDVMNMIIIKEQELRNKKSEVA
ncbi:hypothetical protein SAMN02745248_00597 [Hathewaya proteolytica DSM 3090]|uniref:Uncharacterized protein n=1 Tax=Hathewaya proteolytica DSM 3090 TaxID=1121331 RepID=A0A1M6L2L9_9CLOT|nr:hypothetical protein [Hathewaya proteolytica]SHJ65372.1 hypothetical protein SAMN02745248_00597 [Hathewaya proteolytica DSM 3090]